MKKILLKLSASCLCLVGVVACSSSPSSDSSLPSIKTSEQFRIENVALNVEQLVTPDIQYHTSAEIQSFVTDGIKENLSQAGLLTQDGTMDSLSIVITYHRRFVGDKTPIPSDSLAYPFFDYVIKIKSNDKQISTISKHNLTYRGGFTMNLKVAGGLLRDKSDEIAFIDALSRSVSDTIESLKK
ncbi:hypothetical protein [Marinomonas colpomeniae]|uniref:DUF4136 domain-containing protein n=1 Tax=Marinomonas colpomeniae TaxID=2774408 RepID=A0ABR8P0N1_9GAMM|nr:hypothetical protein [Marinomonas colpomeniae]MBD5771854.1 hypothetical protein [Marinomonas colpomeniae]